MKVLAIGAHPDDIELGCGGALLAHVRRGDSVTLLVMTKGEQGPSGELPRVLEQQEAARRLGAGLLWGPFPDGEVPRGKDAVDVVQRAIAISGADVVYTHSPQDTHQDHEATALATLGAARRATRVLFYEAPSTLNFQPNLYVDIHGLVDGKLDLIHAHRSQVLKNGMVDLEAIEASARYRGFQGRVRYAEAFEASRFVWDLQPAEMAPFEAALADEITLDLDSPAPAVLAAVPTAPRTAPTGENL